MEKTAMDAFNRGWALGFGTRIRVTDPDIEAAIARAEGIERPEPRPGGLQLGLLLLVAMGPLPRPAH